MSRKTRIASALALVGVMSVSALISVSVPAVASASSPLLSGYGGPGAGEQVIVGSTLLNGPHGGSGTGGSSGAAGVSGGSLGVGSSAGASQGGSGLTTSGRTGGLGGAAGSSKGASSSPNGLAGKRGSASRDGGSSAGVQSGGASVKAYVYPSSLRLASADSSTFGISGYEVILILAAIVTLTLVGTLTIRLVRLQG